MSHDQYCSRCGCGPLPRPHHTNVNYVIHSEFVEEEEVETTLAYKHTPETKKKLDRLHEKMPERDRNALGAEMAHPNAPEKVKIPKGTKKVENKGGGWTETTEFEEEDFSIPVEEFEVVRVDNPDIIEEDDDIALVWSQPVKQPVQKTGLVCRDCTTEEDEIIWGPDKPGK